MFDCKIRLVLVAGIPGDVWGTPLPLPWGTRPGYRADSPPAFEISLSTFDGDLMCCGDQSSGSCKGV